MVSGRKNMTHLPRGKPFPKGVSGNPSGSSKLSKEQKQLKQLTQIQFVETASKIISLNIDEMKALGKDPQANVLEGIFARVLTRAYDQGNTTDLNYFVERCMGKVADKMDLGGVNLHGSILSFLQNRNGGADGVKEINDSEEKEVGEIQISKGKS